MRGIPIFTFINKLDRFGKDPLDVLEEIESVLGINTYPMNWPAGMGKDFRAIYDRRNKCLELYRSTERNLIYADSRGVEDPAIKECLEPFFHISLGHF
ncbi:hypothetical protein [Tepidibacillus marianensis]|uniref:hypothetical protein n=1 Tax=Tepidibacillus marianensis TaxID=3131995 RepID=UPI00386465FE